jgi:acyl-CoA thioesterase
MSTHTRSAQQLAELSAEAMLSSDPASTRLGMVVDEISPGFARVRMTVVAYMINSHNICHGGYVFTLADTAFAFACNTYNRVTVASGATIDFLAPVYLEDELTAVASEQALGGRTGVYDVVVTNQQGKNVAVFRGRSHRLQGTLFDEPGES